MYYPRNAVSTEESLHNLKSGASAKIALIGG